MERSRLPIIRLAIDQIRIADGLLKDLLIRELL